MEIKSKPLVPMVAIAIVAVGLPTYLLILGENWQTVFFVFALFFFGGIVEFYQMNNSVIITEDELKVIRLFRRSSFKISLSRIQKVSFNSRRRVSFVRIYSISGKVKKIHLMGVKSHFFEEAVLFLDKSGVNAEYLS